jgi:hypothetical protein
LPEALPQGKALLRLLDGLEKKRQKIEYNISGNLTIAKIAFQISIYYFINNGTMRDNKTVIF